MKKKFCFFTWLLFFIFTVKAMAHFGMVIPSDSMVMQEDKKNVTLKLSFSHPFEGVGMELLKPKVFNVVANGTISDLLGKLEQTTVMEHMAWMVDYKVRKPGVYMFYMEPEPYFEPAEDCFIIHYTKTVIAAFGDDEKWDEELGLKTEIVPLSKPFGGYAGNVFQGIVKINREPAAHAFVEVEYYNENGKANSPTSYMITQGIKADKNGVFTYAIPKAGWWGFAALSEADFKLKHEGIEKVVELGAVIWVKFHEWQTQ